MKGIAKQQQKLLCMINQVKLQSFRTAPCYKYGYEIPRDYEHAKKLDDHSGDTQWQDATALEMSQLHECNTFKDCGHRRDPPNGYKKFRTHLVFDCKYDGHHKEQMVADGHLTDVPLDSVYSGIVSLCGIRILVFQWS